MSDEHLMVNTIESNERGTSDALGNRLTTVEPSNVYNRVHNHNHKKREHAHIEEKFDESEAAVSCHRGQLYRLRETRLSSRSKHPRLRKPWRCGRRPRASALSSSQICHRH